MAGLSGLALREPRIETRISDKKLSNHVRELTKDVFQGKQYDTTLLLQGSVTVAGDTIDAFVEELEHLIDCYRV